MSKKTTKIILFFALFVGFFSLTGSVSAQCPNMTTVSGTTVNFVGELTDHGGDLNTTVWFEYGKTSSYGLNAPQKTLNSPGMYCITVSGLDSCSTYHYRAAASNSAGTSYGENRTFNTSCGNLDVSLKANNYTGSATISYGNSITLNWNTTNADSCVASGAWSGTKSTSGSQSMGNLNSGTYTYTLTCTGQGDSNSSSVTVYVSDEDASFTVNKWVRNLSTGTSFVKSVYASPGESLTFSIKVKAQNSSAGNISVRSTLSDKIIYKGDLKVNNISTSGNIITGINIGNLTSGEEKTITFNADIIDSVNFSFGETELINTAVVSSNQISLSDTAKVIVSKGFVAGIATDISTGWTNNIFFDSFFIPLLIAVFIVWLLKSRIIKIEEWLDARRMQYKKYKSQKSLRLKIAKIKIKEIFQRTQK